MVTLSWNKNSEPDIEGYILHYGTSSHDYLDSVDVGNKTGCTISGLESGQVYYFAVTAYNPYGESGFSEEVSYEIPIDNGTPDEIIIDNGDDATSFTGTWMVSSCPNPYGANSLYSRGHGVHYTYQAPVNGTYTVLLWWTAHANGRSNSVPVEIFDGNTLIDTVYVNQQANGGQWNELGNYTFSGTAKVMVVSEGDISTGADAVRFSSAVPADIIIDNGDEGTSFTGTWMVSSCPNPYGANSLYSRGHGVHYTYQAPVNGTYTVLLWWTAHANGRSNSVPVEIFDGNTLIDTVYVNQQANGGQWNELGNYAFSGTAKVMVVSEGDISTGADAVRFFR